MRTGLVVFAVLTCVGCDDDRSAAPTDVGADTPETDGAEAVEPDVAIEAIAGVQVMMDFTRAATFYDAPFPDVSLFASGVADLDGFPNPRNVGLVRELLAIVDGRATGSSLTGGVFFRLTGPPPLELPSLYESVEDDSPVVLIDVDRDSDTLGQRYAIRTHFEEDGGPFGAENLLSVLPVQGVLLRPNTRYGVVVHRAPLDERGEEFGVSLAMAQLAAGVAPEGMAPETHAIYEEALDALDHVGIPRLSIAGLAVFETLDPTAEMHTALDQVLEGGAPQPNDAFTAGEVFEDYCVFHSTIDMPIFQGGTPPFTSRGGGWSWEEGRLVSQGVETANLVITLPRAPAPEDGYPLAVFIRTGGGGERPLVDRGVRAEAGGEAVTAGSGPAQEFAAVGFAGLSVDGPHGGLRNVTRGDEQFLMFNISNPLALRDNVRQSALEIALIAHSAAGISIDASSCPGLADDEVTFDTSRVALMGHSMGATIAPLTLAIEPTYGAAILSGSGGSWIENVMFKESPLEVRPIAEALLQYGRRDLHRHDPVLTLLQWAGEPADSQVYGRAIVHEPVAGEARHVLMLQGIVDTYILPPIANATSLSMGLDLAGASLDSTHPDLGHFEALADLLPLVLRSTIALPVEGNVDGETTAIVIQYPEGPVEDGHEVAFQTEAPKVQYRCFLQSWLGGVPTVCAAQ